MTRGFITLATGNKKYYKMAVNMLHSFRLHNPDTPMAILCDGENEYTAEFDNVVVLKKAYKDYRDKFSLLVESPYDETIFIEPDCLIYHNLDFFWDLLARESDFSCFGWNDGGIDCWFKTPETKQRLIEIVPELNGKTDAPHFNPGYFFVRKSDKTQKMYNECISIAERLKSDDLLSTYTPILCNGKLRDDQIFNITMSINNFIANEKPRVGKCIFLPAKYKINKIDLEKGRLDVTDKNGKQFTDCSLLHFSTRKAMEEGLYLWQCTLLKTLYPKKKSFLSALLNNKVAEILFSAFRYVKTRIKWILNGQI